MPMPRDPDKGHAALRRGRWTHSEADYFLTLCTEGKRSGLCTARAADDIFHEMRTMQADGSWRVRCATVMPDHIHLLITLGQRLLLGRTIQRLKAKTSAALRQALVRWERGFFDHQLRPDDDCLAIFLYIYLNPYRGGLIAKNEKWPCYYCCEDDWTWFSSYLDHEIQPPEWLNR